MKLLDALERRLGKFAVPGITLYLVFLQSLAFVLSQVNEDLVKRLVLQADLVEKGEWWRLLTFVITPPASRGFLVLFALYFFYLMGSALEGYWGAFRYNVYLLVGYLSTLAIAWIFPHAEATNAYVTGSVFLAFAFLYPDFIIYIFFVLPVKIKWVALVTWVGFAAALVFGEGMTRLLVIASVFNFLLFFGGRLFLRARHGTRHMSAQAQRLADKNKPFHVCAACGITDKTHPKVDFRYCPDCAGVPAYCEQHIHHHAHRTEAQVAR